MGMKNIVDKVEKVDDYTVRFTLKRPEAPFLADMAMDFASILSAEYFDTMMKKGTPERGRHLSDRHRPVRVRLATRRTRRSATRRSTSTGSGRPKIDNLSSRSPRDATARYAKLKTGECHVMAFPKPADLAEMKKDPQLNVLQKEGLNVGYIAFNVEKKPFDNKLVRQALNMAIEQGGDPEGGLPGRRARSRRIRFRRSSGATTTRCRTIRTTRPRRRQLLAQAGYPNGFEVELWYLPVTRPYNPDGKRMAELIQADWEKIGVKAKLVTYEWAEYRKRSKTGEQQVMMFGWSGDNGDPDNFFVPLLGCEAVKGGGNVARWCNKQFEDLIIKAAQTPKQADRAKLYEQAQVIVKEEAPWITIAHSVRFDPVRKEVTGLQDGRDRAPLLQQRRHRRDTRSEIAGRGPLGRVREARAARLIAA